MTVRKLSIALEEDVAHGAALAAEQAGLSLSAWINQAAKKKLLLEDGLAAVREYEAEFGEPTAEQLTEADRILDRLQLPPKRRAR